MSKKYSSSTSTLLIAIALAFMATTPASASKKDDDYKKAVAAAAAENASLAAKLFCALRDEDEKFKDVAQQCNIWMDTMKTLRKQDEKRMADGEAAFKAGRYDDAEQKFKNVKVEDLAAQAKDYLNKIADARVAAQAGAATEKKFQDGVNAYNSNDFNQAKGLLNGISGSHAADAKNYIDRMGRYEAAIKKAKDLADAKNYKDAATSYTEAAAIKPDGPGDPKNSITQMNQLLATANAHPGPNQPGPGPGPSPGGQTTIATKGGPGPGPGPIVPTSNTVPKGNAVKTIVPTTDVSTLINEAKAAEAKGDIGAARGKYVAALAAETDAGKVRAIRSAMDALPKAVEGSTQTAGKDADAMLARAITDFYGGDFERADAHIDDYLSANGSKAGLAYFYRGASKVSRYYLNGATGDKKLMMDATAAFKKAKQVAGFRPPDQKFVSPRVLDAYQSAQ